MRDVLEAIVTHADRRRSGDARRDPALHEAVLDQHRPVQQPHRAQVRADVHAATRSRPRRTPPQRAGARFPLQRRRNARRSCSRGSQPMFFDPTSIPPSPARRRAPGKDILTASANNLYVGVTMTDLEGFEEQHPLNSRLVKHDGRLVEEVYRVGGRYGAQIAAIVAAPRGGDPVRHRADGRGAARADRVLPDRRGRRSRGVRHRVGAGQGVAGRHDQRLHRGVPRRARHQGRVGRRSSSTSTARRRRRSRRSREQRAVVRGPHAVGSEVPQGTACTASPPTPSTSSSKPATRGRSRRSASTCRTIRRSASTTAASRCRCRTSTRRTTSRRCRNSAASSRGRRRKPSAPTKWSAFAGELTTNMHEVIGHGSGKVDERLNGNPQAALKEQFSALEESRADLVALYFLPDPKLVELGLVAGRATTTRSSAPSTRPTRATRWCSCGASARARRSKKTTCATAR